MNYNHKGSLAERFIRFRSSVLATQDTSSELFNTFQVFVPSTLAADNLIGVDISTVQDQAVVLQVNVENYLEVMQGALLAQWGKVFNAGTNFSANLVIVVFYVPDGLGADVFADYLTVTEFAIDYEYLTEAFEHLKYTAFHKTMFSPRYDGKAPGGGEYDDSNYFDMALSLAYLCKNNPEMSLNLAFVHQELPLELVDTNECWLLSKTRAEEIAAATALDVVIAGVEPRKAYFWGMLNFMQAANTWLCTHSENVNTLTLAFAKWFEDLNDSGTYIGNKLEKIRLSGSDVKPTGTLSWLNSEANENLPLAQAEILDDKYVSYLISIADGTINDSVILRAKTIDGTPIAAVQIPKWVDYYVSQFIAKMIAASGTLTKPILKNETTYKRIQEILLTHLQLFARVGRITDIALNMPAYADLPESKDEIVVTQGWSAQYVYDLEKITITGTVVV